MTLLFLLWLATPANVDELTRQVAASGAVVELTAPLSERVAERPRIAPGAPPLLRFRYLEGKQRHRFGDSDLVVDDAGH